MLFFPQPENRPVSKVYLSAGEGLGESQEENLFPLLTDWRVLANWKIMAS